MAPVPLIRRNIIIQRFLIAGATSPETAKTPEDVGSFKGLGLMYSRLEARGVLKSCGDNLYYIDTAGALRDLRRVRSVIPVVFGILLAIAIAITCLSEPVSLSIMIPAFVIAAACIALGVVLLNRK